MEYSLITQDLAYLGRDGFGPLDHSSVLELEDRFGPPTVAQPVLDLEERLGLRPRPDDPVSVSMSLRKGVPRPNILLPNSTCFAGGLLISTDVGASFGLDTALSGAVAAHLSVGFDEMQILLGMPACREETAAAWIDFGASSFQCVDAVSLDGPGDLEVLQPGLRFSSAKMFQDYFTARTVLDIPLPEQLTEPQPALERGGVDEFEMLTIEQEMSRARLQPLADHSTKRVNIIGGEFTRQGQHADVFVFVVAELHAAALPRWPVAGSRRRCSSTIWSYALKSNPMKISANEGSNCVPDPFRISSSTVVRGIADRYVRVELMASNESANASKRAKSGMCSPSRP